jgi:adenylyltransferase/sulfurtransferase
LLTRKPALSKPILGFANIMQTVPSLALFGFLIPLNIYLFQFKIVGGIGARTAIVALVLYSLLPIIRNTVTGVLGVEPSVRDAAVAMGMTDGQVLRQVELPLAMGVIVTGIRVATVIAVGVTTIAAAVGAGGLGAPALLYLAAAGVGTLGVIDDDAVALSNLQRQVIHGTPEVGEPKVESAAAAIHRLNPHVTVETHASRLVAANALDLIGAYDIVADGADNFATRYLVSDACFFARKPLVTAAVGMFDGTLTTLRPYESGTDGALNPTYRCLFPEPPPPGSVPACAEAGILGALTGVLGSLMALEVIREIVGFGEGLVGRLVMFDARSMRFETLQYGWDPSNPLSGEHPTIHDLSMHG